MYAEIRAVPDDELAEYRALLNLISWGNHVAADRNFQSATIRSTIKLTAWPNYMNAFFVKLPAKTGKLHRHTDTHLNSYHIPLQTNAGCINYMYPENAEPVAVHLEVGKLYAINRAVEHDSINTGDCDRIHLIIEDSY